MLYVLLLLILCVWHTVFERNDKMQPAWSKLFQFTTSYYWYSVDSSDVLNYAGQHGWVSDWQSLSISRHGPDYWWGILVWYPSFPNFQSLLGPCENFVWSCIHTKGCLLISSGFVRSMANVANSFIEFVLKMFDTVFAERHTYARVLANLTILKTESGHQRSAICETWWPCTCSFGLQLVYSNVTC